MGCKTALKAETSRGVFLAVMTTCVMTTGLMATGARSETMVSSAKDLGAALSTVTAGETILLAPGDYGLLSLTKATRNNLAVTLRSLDPGDPATFSGLDLLGVGNVTFEAIDFDYQFQTGDQIWQAPFQAYDSHNLTFRRCRFDGDLATGVSDADDGSATGIGLSIHQSTDLTLDENIFFEFFRGLVVSDSDRISVTGNEVHAIRSDGMNFVAVDQLLVANNTLHDFKTSPLSGDHADMIQFWTAGTTRPSRNVVIRDNVLNSGNGAWTQSILMGNELVSQGGAGPEMYYRNITITGNVIINSHLHGISVGETDGLRIANNTLIHNRRTHEAADNPVLWVPRINVAPAANTVIVENNAASAIMGSEGRPDWVVTGNILIQDSDPAAPNYYDDIFVAALTGNPQSLAPFTYLPGGAVDGVKTGAARLIAPLPSGQLAALIRTERDARYINRFTLDAGFSSGPDGLQDARYFWSFGDGTVAEGQRVTHSFAKGGMFRATLTVQPATGPKAMDETLLTVPAADVVHFDPAQGELLVDDGTGMLALSEIPVVKPPNATDWALPVGMGTKAITIPRGRLQNLFNSRDFDLQLRVKVATTADPGGEILRLHNSMILTWQSGKGFGFWLETALASQNFIWTRTPRLDPDIWYQVRVRYDAATGIVAIEVDGKLRARGRVNGPLKPDENQDLNIGNPFGHKSFDGFLGAFDVHSNLTAFAKAGP